MRRRRLTKKDPLFVIKCRASSVATWTRFYIPPILGQTSFFGIRKTEARIKGGLKRWALHFPGRYVFPKGGRHTSKVLS